MRYKNINADFIDTDFLCFTSDEHEGNIVLVATDELIDITRDIIDGKEVGEKTEIEMDMMKGIDVRTVKRRCVVDYCYDAEHILEK